MLLLAFQTTTCEKSLSESSVDLIQYFIKVFQKRVNIIIIVLVIVTIPIIGLEYPGEKQSQPTYGVDFSTELGTHWWKQSVYNTLSPPVANTISDDSRIIISYTSNCHL